MKINGETHYLWRAVDHEGEVLEAIVTKKRDKRAALKLLRKLMRRYGEPETIVTDKLKSYTAAIRELGVSGHENTGRWIDNRCENSHPPFDDENEQCNASGECKVYRNSQVSTHPFTTVSIRNAFNTADIISKKTEPPPSTSGANFCAT